MDKELTSPETTLPVVNKRSCQVWKLALVWLSRILLGGTFIFSGFVKAVDPWGTIYKLQEYFDVWHLSQWSAVCLPLAFILFTVEFMIGVYVLTGCYRRLAVWLATAFMSVMLPLTLWIALKNPVTDCGCFGDAIPLSNWATFWKNVVLIALTAILLFYNRSARCLITPALQWIGFCLTVIFIVLVGWIGYYYQPLVDFRPYPVGGMLADNDSGNDSDFEEVDMIGVYEKDGQQIRLPLDSIPDESWTFVGREIPEEGKAMADKESHTAIYDPNDDSDVTSDVILQKGDQILLFYTSLSQVSAASYYRINSLYNYCEKHNIDMAAVASGNADEIDAFRDLSLSEFPIYLADDTWIKEVVRGNPAVVMLRDGKIVWKSSLAALPHDDFMSSAVPNDFALLSRDNDMILNTLAAIYLAAMMLLIVASFIPSVIKRLNSRKHNRFIKDSSTVALTFFVLLFASCSSDKKKDEPSGKYESATLIYIVANNSLSYNSKEDVEEILLGCKSVDLKKNKVLLYIASPFYDTGLYEVAKDKSGNCSLKLLNAYDDSRYSVDKERISEVIQDMSHSFSAESYGLFLWSHATGWIPYSAPQKSFGDDFGRKINISELASAIPDDMMDYIWFDCCLMGGVESCYELRHKANYIVCSPTEIAAEGAPYQLILPFLAKSNPDFIGAARKEYEYYTSVGNFTIAVVKCDGLDALAASAREIVAPSYPYISTSSIQTYGAQTVYEPSGNRVRVTYYDLAQVYDRYAEVRDKDIADFKSALDETVVYKASTPKFGNIVIDPEHYSGLSVYIPLSPNSQGYNEWVESFYLNQAWSKAVLGQRQ